MIGQEKLLSKLNTLTLKSLPHSLLLVGEQGCGKHTYITEIATKLNIEIEDISESLSDTKILEMQQFAVPKLYIINNDLLKDKNQNTILKLLEEPTEFEYICILCSSLQGILPTILNRCHIWTFENYSNNELSNFTNLTGDTLLSTIAVLNTPGKLLNNPNDLSTYFNDASNIFKYIDTALISNILVLLDRVSYSTADTSKIQLDVFVDILNKQALQSFISREVSFKVVLLTSELVNNSKIFNIDKKKLYEKYLVDLKDELKRYKRQN